MAAAIWVNGQEVSMELRINGQPQTFIPLAQYKRQHSLPTDFGVAAFQPKNWTGLGSLDRAGAALHTLSEQVLAAVPAHVPPRDWLAQVPRMAAAFEAHLRQINPQIGLRDDEIAFAVNGFGDVCSAVAFALARADLTHSPPPPFEQIYAEWLFGTVAVGGAIYDYTHQGEAWQVQVVSHAYGRVGLVIYRPDGVDYVVDKALACPAEGFMARLLADVGARMLEASS